MRNVLLIILIGTFQVVASGSYSQTAKLNLKLKGVTIKEVLSEIEDQSEFYFLYNSELIDVTRKVDVSVQDEKIESILSRLFDKNEVDIVIKDRYIVLSPAEESVFQQDVLKGQVTDEDGRPLPGVTVVVKGTTRGTVTDANGNYSLDDVPENATVVFSFVGMKTQEEAYTGQSEINVSMELDAIGIEEVVAIGYGTLQRKDITGSVSQVGAEQIADKNPTNLATALQGRIPANIVQQSASPGASPKIEIRGISSITGSNDPLWVIDGVPMQSQSVYINPNDIESVDVLKDASATAIYGARGSNGVIIVTTKMIDPNQNRVDVSYDGWVGIDKVASSSVVDMADGAQYAERKRLAYQFAGQPSSDDVIFDPVQLESIALGRSTDWFDLIWGGNAVSHNHHFTVNASGNNMATSISLGYLDENSIIETADFKRYNIKFNNIFNVSDKVKITTSILANHSLRNEMPYELRHVFTLSPLGTPYDEEGNVKLYAYPSEALATNPFADLQNNVDEVRHSGFVGNATFEWEMTDGLTYRFFSGADYSTSRRGEYIGSETYERAGGPHQSNYSNWNTLSTIMDNILSYKKTFDEKHRLDALAGFTTETFRNERVFLNGTDMDYEGLWYNLGAASTIIDKGTSLSEWSIMSFIGRANYTFDEKYILTFTYRYDGSSRLAEGNKWAGFPSAALGWRISEENFMADADFLDNLKLRLSWGTTGNTNVDPYETLGRLGKTYYDWDGAPAIGYNPVQIPNPDLKWEITTEKNIGLDFGIFNGRLIGSADYYNRLTEDLMLERNLPTTSGFSSITQNIGSVRNTGIEVMLDSRIIDAGDFEWHLGVTFAKNNNEIVDLYGDKKDDEGSEWFIGYPIRVDYRTEYLGVWQLGEEQEAAVYNAKPGYPKIRDIENEDETDPKITGLDRQIIPLDPKWTGGLNTTLLYKGFSLDINVITSQGAKAYTNFLEIDDRFNARWNRVNTPYWTPDNPTNEEPMPTADITSNLNLNESDFWLADLSFVRISNINLGYRFPTTFTNSIGVKGLKAYVNVKNPHVWSNFKGMDPETGVQVDDHPTLTSYQFGVNINF